MTTTAFSIDQEYLWDYYDCLDECALSTDCSWCFPALHSRDPVRSSITSCFGDCDSAVSTATILGGACEASCLATEYVVAYLADSLSGTPLWSQTIFTKTSDASSISATLADSTVLTSVGDASPEKTGSSDPEDAGNSESNSLSAAAGAGIALGAILVLALIGVGIWLFVRARRRRKESCKGEGETAPEVWEKPEPAPPYEALSTPVAELADPRTMGEIYEMPGTSLAAELCSDEKRPDCKSANVKESDETAKDELGVDEKISGMLKKKKWL